MIFYSDAMILYEYARNIRFDKPKIIVKHGVPYCWWVGMYHRGALC